MPTPTGHRLVVLVALLSLGLPRHAWARSKTATCAMVRLAPEPSPLRLRNTTETARSEAALRRYQVEVRLAPEGRLRGRCQISGPGTLGVWVFLAEKGGGPPTDMVKAMEAVKAGAPPRAVGSPGYHGTFGQAGNWVDSYAEFEVSDAKHLPARAGAPVNFYDAFRFIRYRTSGDRAPSAVDPLGVAVSGVSASAPYELQAWVQVEWIGTAPAPPPLERLDAVSAAVDAVKAKREALEKATSAEAASREAQRLAAAERDARRTEAVTAKGRVDAARDSGDSARLATAEAELAVADKALADAESTLATERSRHATDSTALVSAARVDAAARAALASATAAANRAPLLRPAEDPSPPVRVVHTRPGETLSIEVRDVPPLEFSLVNHPGAIAVTRLQCQDLVGTNAGTDDDPNDGVSSEYCSSNPSNAVWMDSVYTTPLGARLRLAPVPDWAPFGISAEISTAALGNSGWFSSTVDSSVEPGLGMVSPVTGLLGLDLRADIGGTELTFQGAAGLMLVHGVADVALRPTIGINVSVPITSVNIATSGEKESK